MSNSPAVEYMGFESKENGREYNFQVRYGAGEVCDFTLTIPNEAFTSHRVRYQDAPSLCSLKLHRELMANGNQPSKTNFLITDSELDDFRSAHNKSSKNLYASKAEDDF